MQILSNFLSHFKTPFREIGVQIFPKLTRNQNASSFARKNGSQSLLQLCVASEEVLVHIRRLKLDKILLEI